MSSTSAACAARSKWPGNSGCLAGRRRKSRHQSSSTRPRSFFTVERPAFSFSRRSTEPLVGLVFLRGGGGGSAALATSAVSRCAGVGAVLLLRAEPAGLDDDDAVLGGALAGDLYDARPHALRQAFGVARVETQLHCGRDLVDVLAARAGRADEVLLEVVRMDDGLVGDDDLVVCGHGDSHGARRRKRKGPDEPGRLHCELPRGEPIPPLPARAGPRPAPRGRRGLRICESCR